MPKDLLQSGKRPSIMVYRIAHLSKWDDVRQVRESWTEYWPIEHITGSLEYVLETATEKYSTSDFQWRVYNEC